MSPSRLLLVHAVALLLMGACGRDGEAGDEASAGAATASGTEAAEPSTRRAATPATEEALVEAAARAIAAKDLEALQATAAPELAADLRRLHDEDPEGFWRRGRALVADVESGFDVVFRQDDSAPRWRVLVRFDTGREETMTFTRVGGELRIDQL